MGIKHYPSEITEGDKGERERNQCWLRRKQKQFDIPRSTGKSLPRPGLSYLLLGISGRRGKRSIHRKVSLVLRWRKRDWKIV